MDEEMTAEQAKQEVADCEKEITSIKATLRSLPEDSSSESITNCLKVVLLKTEGLPDTAQPRLKLQLSSPIEEAVLSKTYDPLVDTDDAANAEDKKEMVVLFRGVETEQATLTVALSDADIPLGTSTSYDLAPLFTKLDAMNPQTEYISELPVAILAHDAKPSAPAIGDEEKNEATEMIEPVCTVVLKLVYKPSVKDKREELYDLLNKATQRKGMAVETLRTAALSASRAQQSAVTTAGKGGKAAHQPAVKAGFLNKPSAKKENTSTTFKLKQLYMRTIGPDSIVRKVFPVAKNYILFFGFVSFLHFKGQMLALPPPV